MWSVAAYEELGHLGCHDREGGDAHDHREATHHSAQRSDGIDVAVAEFMRTATRLLRATHNASSPPKQRHAQQVIPAAVAALLPKP